MPFHLIDALAAVFTAIGTVAAAVLAIWGDQVRDYLKGLRVELSLVEPEGDLTLKLRPGAPLDAWKLPRGIVQKDECVRFEIVAIGQNVFSPIPVVFEISWDGQWTENQEEFQRHLVVSGSARFVGQRTRGPLCAAEVKMSDNSNIQPYLITKPIQLTGAWIWGLVALAGAHEAGLASPAPRDFCGRFRADVLRRGVFDADEIQAAASGGLLLRCVARESGEGVRGL